VSEKAGETVGNSVGTKLSVNVNKVATLRNTRPHIGIPGVVRAAMLCLDAGAHGITVHPRPDRRHVTPDDVHGIAELLKRYPHAEYNIEGNPFHGYMDLVREIRPTQCTLVPDEPGAFTSDHGWDLERDAARLRPVVEQLKGWGCRVSLFMDPDPAQVRRAAEVGADRVELYTEPYASGFAAGNAAAVEPYVAAARVAADAGLGVNAGHDLNLKNLGPFLSRVPGVLEVSIGHALIADALEFGLPATVRQYLAACATPAAPV
jgi:pyridoxine 5-phosphate synthase